MFDFADARMRMIESQLRPNRVTQPDVVRAFSLIPRECFVPKSRRSMAYADEAIAIGSGVHPRFLNPAMVTARLIQALELNNDSLVLVVGAGTGYSSAVLAEIAGSVIGLEDDAEMASQASDLLSELELSNTVIVDGPLQCGLPDQGPFDGILIDGAVETVPETLFEQLKEGGRLATVEGMPPYSRAVLYEKIGDDVSRRALFEASSKPLPGFERAHAFEF